MNILQMLQTTKNPAQFLSKLLENNNNPVFQNFMKMAQNGDEKGLENFARNLFKERGQDFDKEFSNFMKQIKR